MRLALKDTAITGLETNASFLSALASDAAFVAGFSA
ncbi:MAG: hypothetical protein AAFR82_10055 [Pseudomonadota bacterium]